ncbi:MAG TPA: M1 family metallopeptidase, partial [Bdellovibrionota bacterium]|nr:M1 family metallopeptidase [Bdellovibrionota bacterium]
MTQSKSGLRMKSAVFGLGLLAFASGLSSCSLSGSLPAEQTRPGSVPGDPEARARQIRRGQANMQVDREGGLRRMRPSEEWQAIDLSAPEFDALHYRVSLSFPAVESQRFDGQVQLTFQPLRGDFQLLSLDSSGLEIRSVRLLNTFEELRFETRDERLLIDLGRAYSRADTLTVLVGYGWARDPNRGIYYRSRDGVRGIETLYSQSEAEESKFWFPGYARPNDRATFESFITVPEPYVAVSNGSLVGVESRSGRRTYPWSLATPVVSYLFVVTAGKFAVHEDRWRGIGVQYYGYPDDMERLAYSLRNTPSMLSTLSDRIGLEYPYEKYAQAVVPQYQWGGMEHVTATTLTDRTLHGPDEDAEFSSEPLVSHELAHQWFGDLATCRSWDHIWLNEGFATFFEGYWTEHSRGRTAYLQELEDGAAWYFSEEDEDPRPVVFPYYRLNLDDYFDSRAYAKGAWVLHMLRTLLGEEAFFKGVRHYIH